MITPVRYSLIAEGRAKNARHAPMESKIRARTGLIAGGPANPALWNTPNPQNAAIRNARYLNCLVAGLIAGSSGLL